MFRVRAVFALLPSTMIGVIVLVGACQNDPDSPPPFPENPNPYDSSLPHTSHDPDSSTTPDSNFVLMSQCPTTPVASTPMTCDWLASTSNCWANALKVVSTCGSITAGTLSTDKSTCTGNGDTARFSAPYPTAPLAANTLFTYSFTSADAGATCYSLLTITPPAVTPVTTTGGLGITTPTGCVSLTYENSITTVTCEDGSAHTGDADTLNDTCATPSWDFDSTTSSYGLELEWGANSFGEDENVVPVTCETSP